VSRKRGASGPWPAPAADVPAEKRLRIIGGQFRGRLLYYSGDPRTRPMKDRVREAVFNLLGPSVRDKLAFDLFAGTGALGLEALSRGAVRATFIERHIPTARLIEQNAALLGVESQVDVVAADTFFWGRTGRDKAVSQGHPWLVFCSPPYDLYVARREDMLTLIRGLLAESPAASVFVVESDRRFDFGVLADLGAWDVREYPPAVIGMLERPLDIGAGE
jgi:16S rRNA (guanine(966)-N(2))-methyltransferase RsmD